MSVSVIIPTYNRFKYLLNTIQSIKEQTLKPLEIIVVNDCSTQKEYYDYDWSGNGIIIIHLPKNSREIFGIPSPQRNRGIEIAKGEYIAFCDDDDIWFPNKLELQIKAMNESSCGMSSTDGLIGNGQYNKFKQYAKYNAEHYYRILQQIYARKESNALINGFPKIWTRDFLKIHNCVICSSVVIKKTVIDKVGLFATNIMPGEDYEYWLRILQHTNSVYVPEICFYYDSGHGDGRLY